jgi:ParB/RepB/Spo0J family partition protein
MNAPATAAALAKPSLQLLKVAAIVPSKTHVQEMRRARFDQAAMKELARNIADVGILQPPLARPLGDKHELVAGERRWLAAKLAGLTEIYVNVRELTDDQALEAQLSENLQREDLHELEEAEGYEELMKLKKINAEAVADMIGKSRSYVYARTKLLALCPEARKAFYAGALDASRALLIARIGHHDTQRQALRDLTSAEDGHFNDREPMSYREAHRHILDNYMLALKSAPFDIKDATLVPKAGDCIKCPKRTGNQQDLFGDVKNADVCTDPKCFDDKQQAHQAGARSKLELAGKKVIYGDAAKKIFPRWEESHDWAVRQVDRKYLPFDEQTYISGRGNKKPSEVLGADYQPLIVQHPKTGQFVKLITQEALSKALQAAARTRANRSSPSSRSSSKAPTTQKPPAPDIEDLVSQRVEEILLKKPIGLDRHALLYLAECESDAWDTVSDHLLSAFKLSTIGRVRLDKLNDKDLGRFLVLGTVADGLSGYGAGLSSRFADALCKRHKINPKKIKAEILEEITKKKAEAAKPKLPTSSKPAWSTTPPPLKSSGGKKPQFMTPMLPSDQLAVITGVAWLTRTDVTKKVWGYIKRNGLQDKKNPRFINPDATLQLVFGGKKRASMFEMTKLVSKHLKAQRASKAKGKKK